VDSVRLLGDNHIQRPDILEEDASEQTHTVIPFIGRCFEREVSHRGKETTGGFPNGEDGSIAVTPRNKSGKFFIIGCARRFQRLGFIAIHCDKDAWSADTDVRQTGRSGIVFK
jgi:hypothetical protein